MQWSELQRFATPSVALWPDPTAPQVHDRVSISVASTLSTSLALICVNSVALKVERRRFGPDLRLRARFAHGGTIYNLSVTDPLYEAKYTVRPLGTYTLGRCYLTISLGEEFKGDAYKLVAAIFEP